MGDGNMGATDILIKEHRAIEIVLDIMEKAANRLDAGEEVDLTMLEECLDFVTGFVEGYHHVKEEEILFPKLEQQGIPKDGGPIGQMIHEHDEGRAMVKCMRKSISRWRDGDASARKSLLECWRNYINLLRSHIQKEDNVLFAEAARVLTDEDIKQLENGYHEIARKKMGHSALEEYRTMLVELRKRADEEL